MVKFIATDLDGTLLDDNRKIPSETFTLIDELSERGILFAPASGRQYANLYHLFQPVADRVLFVCENGALVKYRGKTLYLNPIDDELIKPALDEIRRLPHLFPLVCGENNAYYENDAEPFARYARLAYDNCVKVDSLDNVIGREAVCKIAVYDEIGSAKNCIRVLPQKLPRLRTILSGKDWCDVSSLEANKGEAVRFIREYFHFGKDECAAFGDHMNDYEMLLECGHPYVTENAYPPLKKLVGKEIGSNSRYGVLVEIKRILGELI